MSKTFATQIGMELLSNPPIKFLFADGNEQIINEKVSELVSFEDVSKNLSFFVSESLPSKYNIICGIDFCQLFGLEIIFDDEKATINPSVAGSIPFMLIDHVTIDPGELKTIELKNSVIKDGTMTIIPVKDSTISNTVMYPIYLVSIINFVCYVMIFNHSPFPMSFARGTKVFVSDECEDDDMIAGAPLFSMSAKNNDYHVNENLTADERKILDKFLAENDDLFAVGLTNIPASEVITHRIPLYDERNVVHVRPYRMSMKEMEISENIAKNLLHSGFIRRSISEFSNPVILVRKPNGDHRMCLDFRRLNKLTRKDVYSMPRMDQSIDDLSGQKYFTNIDCAHGFWGIPIDEQDMHKTSFLLSSGSYEWTRMPFGLTGAPSTYARMMDRVFGDIRGKKVTYFFDDIVVLGRTFEEHMENLYEVFARIRKAKLRLQRPKCSFAETKIKFLGYIIENGNVSPDPQQVAAILKMDKPKTVEQLQSFLGKCSFFRNFIRNFSFHANPLYAISNGREVKWTPEAEEKFEFMKQKLSEGPILKIFDPKLEVTLHCDASGYAVGCCVMQMHNKKYHPVAYYSRMMNDAERKMNTTEKEMLACIFGIRSARHYIYGVHFYVITDHSALKYLMNLKDTKNRRLASWNSQLQGYNFTVIHNAGKNHCVPDSLSRNPLNETIPETMDTDLDPLVFTIAVAAALPDMKIIIDAQKDDDLCIHIRNLTDAEKDKNNYIVDDDICYKRVFTDYDIKRLIVLPLSMLDTVYNDNHEHSTACHQSITRTTYKINQSFWRPKLMSLIERKIKTCTSCQLMKPRNRPLNSIPGVMPTTSIPFAVISVDLSGPWPKSIPNGNLYTISVIDCATRYLIVGAIPNKRMATITDYLLKHIYYKYSIPRQVITDRGLEFTNKLIDQLHNALGIKHVRSTSYNPRANSQVERSNRNVNAALRHYLQDKNEMWEEYIYPVQYALNTSIHETLGQTPFFLLYAYEPTNISQYKYQLPVDVRVIKQLDLIDKIRKNVEERVMRSQKKIQERDAQKFIPEKFSRGDLVLLDIPYLQRGFSKHLQPKYRGPYIIEGKVESQDATYIVRRLDTNGKQPKYERVNLRHMKRYFKPQNGGEETNLDTVNVSVSVHARALRNDQPTDDANDDFYSLSDSRSTIVNDSTEDGSRDIESNEDNNNINMDIPAASSRRPDTPRPRSSSLPRKISNEPSTLRKSSSGYRIFEDGVRRSISESEISDADVTFDFPSVENMDLRSIDEVPGLSGRALRPRDTLRRPDRFGK